MKLPNLLQLRLNGTNSIVSAYMLKTVEVYINQLFHEIMESHVAGFSSRPRRHARIGRIVLRNHGAGCPAAGHKLTSAAGCRPSRGPETVKIVSSAASAEKMSAPAGHPVVGIKAPKAKKISAVTAGSQKVPGGFKFQFRGMSAPSAPTRHLPKRTKSFNKMGPRILTEKPAQPRPENLPGMSNFEDLLNRPLV